MSYTAEQLLKMASDFDNVATNALVVTAKKKEKKKLDPKAKVRNRGTVCVPAESAKDKKDHFPINDEGQARNALARVHQYSSAPEWYSGSLKGLQALVARKVKAKYPKIDVGGKDSKKKKASEYYDTLLAKLAQEPNYGDMNEYELAQAAQQAGQQDHPGIGKVSAEVWLKSLADQGKITGRSYQAALGVLKMMPGPNQQQPTIELDDQKPTPTPQRLPVRKDVQTAQQQLVNMGGFDLGTTGPQGNGVDGQLGSKTIQALKKYNPNLDPEAAIKELNQKASGGIIRENPF